MAVCASNIAITIVTVAITGLIDLFRKSLVYFNHVISMILLSLTYFNSVLKFLLYIVV